MLMASLTDASSYEVRFSAVRASVNYLLLHEKDTSMQKHFADIIAPILTVRFIRFYETAKRSYCNCILVAITKSSKYTVLSTRAQVEMKKLVRKLTKINIS